MIKNLTNRRDYSLPIVDENNRLHIRLDIGDCFIFKGKTYKVVKSNNIENPDCPDCSKCCVNQNFTPGLCLGLPPCSKCNRIHDHTPVHYVEVK